MISSVSKVIINLQDDDDDDIDDDVDLCLILQTK